MSLVATGQDRTSDAPVLSDQAEVSVLTIGPWQGELYSAFGHSAFRVYDPQLGIDAFFNYGVFDFNQPNFYLNFARGNLNYKLDVDPYPLYRDYYVRYNRYLHEQILNLTPRQKQTVFDYLVWNAKPENQYYSYDYFYNNCASKLRDILKETLHEEVQFDSTYITTNYTIRDLTDLYLGQQPWGDLGIDICLGLPMDKVASPYEYMFLPDYIESSFNHATIRHDSVTAALVRETVPVNEAQPEPTQRSLFHPWLVFGALLTLTLTITWIDIRRGKSSWWLDVVLFDCTGLIGWLLLLLWVATDHQAAARNMNLLWAMPLHVVAVPLLWWRPTVAQKYFKAIAVLNIIVLLTWAWLPQALNVFLIPVVLALTVRAAWIGWRAYTNS